MGARSIERPGNSDDIFFIKNPNFCSILVGPGIFQLGIFYGHSVYLVEIWYMLWLWGRFCGHFWCIFWYMYCANENLAALRTSVLTIS
jgi:hypothetical protein